MNKPIVQAFDSIIAEEELKNRTLSAIYSEKNALSKFQRKAYLKKMTTAMASFLLIFFVGGFSLQLYYTPAASISIDTNPSLELWVNRFDRIVDFDSHNLEGEKLLEGIQLKHQKCNTAIERIVDALSTQGYLLPNNLLSVTLQTGDTNKEKQLLQELQTTAKLAVLSHHSESEVEVYPISSEISQHAHDLKLSPAKYLAITNLQKIDAKVTMEECRNHSVKELRDMVIEGESHMKSHDNRPESNCNKKNSSVHGHGHKGR